MGQRWSSSSSNSEGLIGLANQFFTGKKFATQYTRLSSRPSNTSFLGYSQRKLVLRLHNRLRLTHYVDIHLEVLSLLYVPPPPLINPQLASHNIPELLHLLEESDRLLTVEGSFIAPLDTKSPGLLR